MADFIYPRDFFTAAGDVDEENLCFVLMPFAEEFLPVYEDAIRPTVESAGLRCKRSDDIFSTTPVLVDIMQHISKSRVVIADLTGGNPNVFYELGLTHVVKLNTAVILLAQGMEHVPFDLRHLRVIEYENSDSGISSLSAKLGNTLRPHDPNAKDEPGMKYVLWVESLVTAPGTDVVVDVMADAPAPGIGAFTIDVIYDSDLLTAMGADVSNGVCNHSFNEQTVRFVGVAVEGLAGRVRIGRIYFRVGPRSGVAELRPIPVVIADPSIPPRYLERVELRNGRITIQAA